ncbi:DegT/DnrJ/EryC1/StrS family aminotransferase [Thalassospira tepidiphila]|uniref:DegT/DnrJ/EryC1/StrS family aminotransferase n=1 Tax=Thalassospira tepidiphila TaxID=393657 RepID=UPI003AA95819
MSSLAMLGGSPVITKPLPGYRSIGPDEQKAVLRVMETGSLSGFYGSWDDQFFGGTEVKALEKEWSERFGCKYAISVNSNTSGLCAAMGAIGVSPGDEVIVSPYTMSATAMAPLFYGGIPIFADIDPATFCMSPEDAREKITPRTKAILVTNLFGQAAELHELRQICEDNNIFLVEDAAQSPNAYERGKHSGTIGDIGVYSLNYHKHIHSGEGGICVTNDPHLARRMQMIRNHAEAVAEASGETDLTNLVGYNFRMTELSAAVARTQLKNINQHVAPRVQIAEALTKTASEIDFLTPPYVKDGCNHVYYVWAAKFNQNIAGIPRDLFSKALTAEGFPHFQGYLRPLYKLPLFQQKIAIGRNGFPFNLHDTNYNEVLCPVAEDMHYNQLIGFEPCAFSLVTSDIQKLQDALQKVASNIDDLREYYHSVLQEGSPQK